MKMKLQTFWLAAALAAFAQVQTARSQQTAAPTTPGQSGARPTTPYGASPSHYGVRANAPFTGERMIQRGSELIGKSVENAQNEKLGTIKDFAIDLPSGRLAYVVVQRSTGFLARNTAQGNLVAVPPWLFTKSAAGNFLVLNASKQQLDTMPGFSGKNWPAQAPGAWGAAPPGLGGTHPFNQAPGTERQYNHRGTFEPNQHPSKY